MRIYSIHFLTQIGLLSLSPLFISPPAFAQTEMTPQTENLRFPDVDSSTWAAESIYLLNERYGCLEGFPDGSFQGDNALTRYQFAAGLYACLRNYDAEIQNRIDQLVTKEDLAILFRVLSTLFEEASPELEGGGSSFPNELPSPSSQEQNPLVSPEDPPLWNEMLPYPSEEEELPTMGTTDSTFMPRDR